MTMTILYRTQSGEVFGIIGDDDGRDPMTQAQECVAERDRDLSPGYEPRIITEAWRAEVADIADWFGQK